MNKTEAAEILATALVVRARSLGAANIDKTFYEAFVTECWNGNLATEGTALWQAAQANPSYKTVRAAGRRNG